MKAKIEINLDNDAFKQNPLELANVLRNLAEDIEYINGPNLGTFIGIADINGNTVGSLEVVQDNGEAYTCMVPDGDDNHYNE